MSRSLKVNEPETMSTASAYLYKEQAECVQQVHQYLVEHLDSRVTQAELAQRYHISLTSLKGAFKQVYGLPINTYLRRCCAFCCAVIPHQAIVFSSGSWSVRTRRHSRGVMPFSRLNIAAKRLGLSYPTRCAISKMLKSVVELQRSKTHSSGGLKLGKMVERGT